MLAFLSLGSAPNPMLQEGDLNSPLLQQHPSSPFLADALLSSATSCTSTPMTPEEPELFDLGVDIQAELEKDAPELSDFMLLDPQGKMTLCCTHTFFFSLCLCNFLPYLLTACFSVLHLLFVANLKSIR